MTKLGKEIQRGVIAALVSFMCLHTAAVFAASPNTRNTVRGKIVNETGEPIIGAIVTLKGNKNVGTTTDVEGNFVLAYNDHKAEALNVNYIGCSSMEVEVKEGEENVGTIKMSQDAYSLQDVVVIGYGETSREKLVGSVAKVKGEVIATQTQDAPILGLQGNAAGVYIEECSGVPGSSNSTIVVRGYNALTTSRYNNMPLYIVDGIPFANTDNNPISEIKEGVFETPDPLALINPSDIESIEILKDADATAIYGTRGANGVVLVTTKKGKQGKLRIDFSADATVSWMSKRKEFCSTEEYLALRKEAFDYDLKMGYVKESDWNETNFPDFFLWDQNADYNWQEALMGGTAWAKNVQLSVSGGNKNTSFRVSGAYYRASTVTNQDDIYTRWTGSANLQHHSDDNRFRLEAGVNVTNLMEESKAAITAYAKLNTAPNLPPFDENGNPYYIPGDPDFSSPMASRGYSGVNDVTNFMGNATLSYNFWDELVGKVKFAYGFSGSHENNNYDKYYQNPYKDTPYSWGDYASINTKSVSVEPQITWSHNFFGGKTSFLLGAAYEYSNNKVLDVRGKDYASDLLLRNAAAANIIYTHKNPETQKKEVSWFGRINYDYKNRYIANVVLRNDGSSNFGRGNRWGTFYSLGGGWLFTNEKFVKDSKASNWLSFGKLRMSYGKTGNENLGSYAYMSYYNVYSYPYNGELGLIANNLGDENLHWETVHKFDVGLELGFFKDRLLFSANYYCNTSSELLKSAKLASQAGFDSYTTNIDAKIRNTGWEFELNAKILDGKNWKWSSNVNMTFPKNKLIKYTGLERSAYASSYVIGESINLIKRYLYTGIDPETGIPQFVDVNGDGKISSSDDRVFVGDLDPDMYGGWNNTIKYKNFTLDLSFYFRVKPQQSGFWSSFGYAAGMQYNVLRDYAQNHWSETNKNASYPGLTTTSSSPLYTAMSYLRSSDYALSTGSYIKLSSLKLSYNLPKSLLSKVRIADASVFVQGKNLFYITGYDGYTVETGGSYIPPLMSFSFGMKIGL